MNETKFISEKGRQEFFTIREFDAPREMVFEAFIDPELLVQWLGPRDLVMRVEKLEARKGGSYGISIRGERMNTDSMGSFMNGVAPERIIQTFEFDGLPVKGHVCLSTNNV